MSDRSLFLYMDYMHYLSQNLELLQIRENEIKELRANNELKLYGKAKEGLKITEYNMPLRSSSRISNVSRPRAVKN
jgi:hypothetical protein